MCNEFKIVEASYNNMLVQRYTLDKIDRHLISSLTEALDAVVGIGNSFPQLDITYALGAEDRKSDIQLSHFRLKRGYVNIHPEHGTIAFQIKINVIPSDAENPSLHTTPVDVLLISIKAQIERIFKIFQVAELLDRKIDCWTYKYG